MAAFRLCWGSIEYVHWALSRFCNWSWHVMCTIGCARNSVLTLQPDRCSTDCNIQITKGTECNMSISNAKTVSMWNLQREKLYTNTIYIYKHIRSMMVVVMLLLGERTTIERVNGRATDHDRQILSRLCLCASDHSHPTKWFGVAYLKNVNIN